MKRTLLLWPCVLITLGLIAQSNFPPAGNLILNGSTDNIEIANNSAFHIGGNVTVEARGLAQNVNSRLNVKKDEVSTSNTARTAIRSILN